MPLLRLLAATAVLATTLAVAALPAAAEDRATKAARKHYDKGEKLFALGRFDAALLEYEAAFEAKALPGFLFNIGQCHRNLGDYDAAIFSFKKYLKLDPDADNKEAVLELIDELEAERKEIVIDEPPPPPPPRAGGKKPIYKKWWFWGGVAAVAGASTGTYLLLRDDGVPDTDLGNVVFR
jgi:tetratricopeptide (TPR) repeat protein